MVTSSSSRSNASAYCAIACFTQTDDGADVRVGCHDKPKVSSASE
ncbi:hypothetical protein CSIRO_0031 [Bradyrhizobiaceae bacterium SG-6C]|nr:hypothetical protein CSIRO_0031 [Bradyrhizobiaceae bacterium SG-6C]